MRTSPVGLALLTALVAGMPAQVGKVAYADHGRAYLMELGEKETPPLSDLLDRHYTRLLLADFDLRVPNTMLVKGSDVARVAAIAGTILDLQDRIAEFTAANANALKAQRADIAALRKYVTAWRDKPAGAEPPTVSQRVKPCLLVIAPDRKNFVGFVGWLGLWKEQYQAYWWNDATAQFSDLGIHDEGDVQVITLEYAAPNQNGDVTLGYDMNTREKTGLLQHVLQRAAVSWCWRWLGEDADMTFMLGFATDLVVDVLGQNNARSGGSGKSSVTEGTQAFIPGAPSQGGGMQMVNADSSWRLSLGQDYFARVLRQAQKAGEHESKNTKDKLGHFLLRDAKGEKKHLVNAPFLGKIAFDRDEVPAAFLDDYMEFHRAYRAGFVHWLQCNGAKTKAASTDQFRTLMLHLMDKKPVAFEALCEAVYEIPLSAKSAETDTLERRFLAWIATNSR